MKILSTTSIRLLEKETINQQAISSHILMERAARMVFHALQKSAGECCQSYIVLCGFGNNGGDGLALARMLHEAGHRVSTYLLEHERYSDENICQQKKLKQVQVEVMTLQPDMHIPFPAHSVLIDALFGHGLSRPLDNVWHILFEQISRACLPVVSIDIPSGLPADLPLPIGAPVIHANHTYTFAYPKLNLLLPEYATLSGSFSILDIGLDKKIAAAIPTNYFFTCKEDLTPILKPLEKFSHKGTFGHALIAGGKRGSIGAVILASKAALRTGCGLVTAYVPACGYEIIQNSFPEALVETDSTMDIIHAFPEDLSRYSASALGMGMGTAPETQQALFRFFQRIKDMSHKPRLLFDADALNILSIRPEWHDLIPANSILTPHPKELSRLLGQWDIDAIKFRKAQTWCRRFHQILVIKGAHSAVVLPDGPIYFNSTGNPGMATAGSGDVLSGMITALLAQGYEPKEAAIIGVYLHGLAGDQATLSIHPKSLLASDIIHNISNAWKAVQPQQTKHTA
ncbi:NAD(P)H-hydrate dehydratase [Sphingobacterium suaedae]|uniref:Bifunctional NAD(P)H-hydrate repair enzyme n=1 Tax=Sphingobacterium suaedae TaxID=1686402 RepID=A0ABW5KG16_9SPHI